MMVLCLSPLSSPPTRPISSLSTKQFSQTKQQNDKTISIFMRTPTEVVVPTFVLIIFQLFFIIHQHSLPLSYSWTASYDGAAAAAAAAPSSLRNYTSLVPTSTNEDDDDDDERIVRQVKKKNHNNKTDKNSLMMTMMNLTTPVVTMTPQDEKIQLHSSNNVSTETTSPTTTNAILPLHRHPSATTVSLLPQWIINYVTWHNKIRTEYPGSKLLTDPNAPKVLLRTCYDKCGGLHDRLGKLPWDLYLANQTNRILLLHWCTPASLETFLIPNTNNSNQYSSIDWTVPEINSSQHQHRPNHLSDSNSNTKSCYDNSISIRPLFEGYSAERPNQEFWDTHLDTAIQRAITDPIYREERILRHQILGMDSELSKRLKALNETDMLTSGPSFGRIFDLFFQPSHDLQLEINHTMESLQLVPGQYSAAHCRVRHPKSYPSGTKGKVEKPGGPDKWGLLFEGKEKEYAISIAQRAIHCAQTHLSQPDEPIYFYADSEDLVRYIPKIFSSFTSSSASQQPTLPNTTTINIATATSSSSLSSLSSSSLSSSSFLRGGTQTMDLSSTQSGTNATTPTTTITTTVVTLVTRNITGENLHIDRQVAIDSTQFFGSFIDLWVGSRARCVAYGVGNYAYFAYKLSGTSCGILYQEEKWDSDGGDKRSNSFHCPTE